MPFSSQAPFEVAVVQAAPVFLDREASIQKLIALTQEAAGNGARLVLFPEAFIPGYPRGLSFGATVGSRSAEGRALFRRYADAAVSVPGPEIMLLSELAAKLSIYLAVGLVAKDAALPGTLYCSLALWGPDGTILNLHRKIKPTASERLIWGEGDGTTIGAIPTDIGAIGGLICWENLMPLARTALYNQGVELYLAPTADARESWQATIRHIALEGRCFVLSCNQYVTKADYPADLGKASMREIEALEDPLCRGGSAIIGPLGDYLAGPLWDEEGILYATIDPGAIAEARFDFDVTGHYSRPDLFRLWQAPGTGLPAPGAGGLDAALGELLFGGGPLLMPPLGDDDLDEFFGPEVEDSFFPSFPTAWTEKKPATKLTAKPTRGRRRPNG